MIKWNESLSVGIEKVDMQHKKLFEIIDQLTVACSERRGQEELGKVINFLENYVKDHFRDEEKVMLDSNYPKYLIHKKEHDEFTKQLNEIIATFKSQGVNLKVLVSTNQMIYGWLRNHILQLDKEIGVYLRSKNTL